MSATAVRRLTLNYRPHPAQRPFHESPARVRCIVSGRRFGKTTAASAEVLRILLSAPRRRGWMVAPVYDQVMECWHKVREILPDELVANAARSAHRLELVNGSLLEFRSADDPEHLRGAGLDALAVDEAARVSAEAWWALYPATSIERGRIVLTSTPRGRNWFWEVFRRGADGADPEYAAWRFASTENPHFTAGEWGFARSCLPADWFAQEYQAEFLAGQAQVFRGLELCVSPGELIGPQPNARYSVGVDLGKLQDYTAICVLRSSDRRLVHFERMLGIDWPKQRRRIAELAARYPGELWLDSTGLGEVVCDELWREGLRPAGYVLSAQGKEQLVGHLALGFENGDVLIPRCAATAPLREELAAYEYRLAPGGRVSYGAPAGGHDDSVVALALAYWGARHFAVASRI
jgi:hypothetical protein